MVGCVLMNATALLTRGSSASFFVDMLVRPRINFDPQKIEQSTTNSQVTRTIVVQDAEKNLLVNREASLNVITTNKVWSVIYQSYQKELYYTTRPLP